MTNENQNSINELKSKILSNQQLSPLDRCWAIRNYIGKKTQRYDVADDIGSLICDLIIQYQPNDKMKNRTDDNCKEYWLKTKDYIISGR